MEIISDNKNALFKRQELVLKSDKNLSFDEAKKEIAGMVGKDEELVDVNNVKGGFGKKVFEVSARVYDNKEDLETMKNMELSRKKKKEIAEAKAKAEEEKLKAEEEAKAAAEAPAEENVESTSEDNVEAKEESVEEKTE